jgi:hypothetical protein
LAQIPLGCPVIAAVQATQRPRHAVLQQVPCAQCPLTQSPSSVQPEPLGSPAAQTVSEVLVQAATA